MKNVEVLTGDPKKAILKLSAPMVVSNLIFTLYNLVDGIWVAGLGPDALSAVGMFFPIFFVFIAISFGLSVGANSAVSRRIGAKRYDAACVAATLAVAMGILVSIPMTLSVVFLNGVMVFLGADGEILRLAVDYGSIMLLGSLFLVFSNVSAGILNGEGNARMAMYANAAGSLLNMVLDPIFIYLLGYGIAGAAIASVISMALSSIVFAFWFLSGRSYVRFRVAGWNLPTVFDLLRVGMPASLSMLTMSVAFMLINRVVIETGGSEGLAAYTSAWRLIQFGFVPLFGVSAALTAVSGAAYGARNPRKIGESLNYTVKLLLAVDAAILALMVAFAPQIALIFTYTEASAVMYEEIVRTIRIAAFVLLFAPLGVSSSAVFQGMGKGERSFAITVLRAIVFQVSLCYFLAVPFGFDGVLLGFVLGEALGCFTGFSWVRLTVRRLERCLPST